MDNLRYEILVYWSNEDNCFIAEMPELPGCMADGETYEKAVENIKNVAKMWMEVAKEEGREIPEPKGKLYYA
jgi:predicted RNase H-like HicB family nuclease